MHLSVPYPCRVEGIVRRGRAPREVFVRNRCELVVPDADPGSVSLGMEYTTVDGVIGTGMQFRQVTRKTSYYAIEGARGFFRRIVLDQLDADQIHSFMFASACPKKGWGDVYETMPSFREVLREDDQEIEAAMQAMAAGFHAVNGDVFVPAFEPVVVIEIDGNDRFVRGNIRHYVEERRSGIEHGFRWDRREDALALARQHGAGDEAIAEIRSKFEPYAVLAPHALQFDPVAARLQWATTIMTSALRGRVTDMSVADMVLWGTLRDAMAANEHTPSEIVSAALAASVLMDGQMPDHTIRRIHAVLDEATQAYGTARRSEAELEDIRIPSL